MQPFRRVGLEQGTVTAEEYRFIETQIVESIKPRLIARRLFPVSRLSDAGWMEVRQYEETDMSQATISLYGETQSEDKVVYNYSTLKIPIIHKDFYLHWREILAGRHRGETLEAANARNAARQVAEEEDKLLLTGEYTGWPALGINGLVTGAGNTVAGGAWPANAIPNINLARAALQASGFVDVDFVLIGRTAQIKSLDGQIGNTGFTTRTFLLNNKLVSAIYESDNVFTAAGLTTSALLVVPGAENFDLVVAQEVALWMWQNKNMNYHGKVYEAVVPRIKRSESICTITGLSVA